MSTHILTQLAQLRSVLREVHTSGDDTMLMAGANNLLNQIIQSVQEKANDKNEEK